MAQKLVVKDSALINASYRLDLVEQRLILLAIVEARDQAIKSFDGDLCIHAETYIKQFGVTRQAAYISLKEACDSLFERQFSYKRMTPKNNVEIVKSRWVQRISYVENEARVALRFADDVIPFITQLEKQFTSYELSQVSNLTSTYSIRLYELLIAWRSTGETPVFELEEFRNKLGLNAEDYTVMGDFKKRVLDLAIKQINDHTDISAEYEQHKRGRTITGFSFSFSQKSLTKKPEAAKRVRKPKVSSKVATPSEMDTPALPPKERRKPKHSATDILKTVLAKR